MANYVTSTSDKNKKTAAILCACGFLGIGGLHQFYVGRIGKGILYLFTGGLFFIGTIADLISIATGGFRDNAGAPLRITHDKPAPAPQPAPAPIQQEYKVYVEAGGAKYHTNEYCSGMKNPQYIPLSVARSRGLVACQKCADHTASYRDGMSAPPPTPHVAVSDAPAAPEYEFMKFNVAGVTFKNGRKHRQTILRAIKFRDPPFEKEIELGLSRYEYEGKPAFSITANDEQIGNVPAELCEYLDENYSRILGFTHIEVYGGGEGRNFGAEVILRLKNGEPALKEGDSL